MKNLKKFEAFSTIISDEDFIANHKDLSVAELKDLNISFDKISFLKNALNSDILLLVDLSALYPTFKALNDKKKAANYQVGNYESVFNFIPNAKSHKVTMNTTYSPSIDIVENLESVGWKIEFVSKAMKTAVQEGNYYTVIMSKQTSLIEFITSTTSDVSTSITSLHTIIY